MNARYLKRILLVLAVVLGAWLWWPRAAVKPVAVRRTVVAAQPAAPLVPAARQPANLFLHPTVVSNTVAGAAATNKFARRLTNTTRSLHELMHEPRAILLANALLDTRLPLNLTIPKNLQASGEPGAFIVQANGAIGADFRAMLAASGAQIVSYIPNNAYLVRASAGQAAAITGSSLTAAVLPYEPYYKVSASLLAQATQDQPLPAEALLNLGVFKADAAATEAAVEKMGGVIVAQDVSPFGPIFRVSPPAAWTALAQLPGVQVVEPTYRRREANDLARVTLGISADTLTNANYLGLNGKNVTVEVNDSGIDQTHPDFSLTGTAETGPAGGSRILGDSPGSLVDTDGHGTHVAGIIAGNGSESYSVTNPPSGSLTNADFRGKAPLATLFSVGFENGNDTPYNTAVRSAFTDISDISDYYLQSMAARTNALISNNSWTYAGDSYYDLAAASFDAAVRDALPMVPGSQPVLFVFAAGNNGGGNDDGAGGNPDSVESPGTAKDVVTVGALEQFRNITNIVTDQFGNSNAVWQAGTDSGTQVAGYSSRGNVGVGVEGDFGRFKPDVVAPGTFVVSTRSSQWNDNAYYNLTNTQTTDYPSEVVDTNGLNYYNVPVPPNAVGVNIQINPNKLSPNPFVNLPIYVEQANYPIPPTYDFVKSNNVVNIPSDGPAGYLGQIVGNGFWFAIGDSTNIPVNYDVQVSILVTNDVGDYYLVLSNLNATLAPYYRYETGTSMAAPAVSGMLALIQDYFTNTLQSIPSPALLKAMLINGARVTGGNDFAVTNNPNFQGWGLANLPTSLPAALTNQATHPTTTPFFYLDQSPTNALATGDSQTFKITVDPGANADPLRFTLTWTDPPGDPNAAIKLVNNLDIVVTNLDSAYGSNTTLHYVYYGNNFATAGNPPFSLAAGTNGAPKLDVVNNVRNIYLPSPLSTNYTVTVVGRSVNVNAVSAQTNNVVQDYALVISAGDGYVSNALTVVAGPVVSSLNQDTTYVATTNAPLMNQTAGENTPLLGTNSVVGVNTNSALGSNSVVTLGMTNQWHFYVVTNTLGYANAAFLTFFPYNLSVPRMGTLAGTTAQAVRPEGDIDLYVASEPGLLNLDPTVISNCVNGVGGDAASLGQGGTEFVAYSNSVQNQVYYIGVKSEDHQGVNYGFLPVFSAYPFSTLNPDGSQSVYGLTLPANIPDGNPKKPGVVNVFALALYPMTVNEVIETNGIGHQNYGDLAGQLSHASVIDVLNNHDAYGNSLGLDPIIYYDAINNPINTPIGPVSVLNPHLSDGPGSLVNFQGQPAVGPWILTETDNSYTQTGSVSVFGLRIYPHNPADKGIHVYISGHSSYNDYVDVPAGVTNFTLSVTNQTLPPTLPPLELYERFASPPTPQPQPTVYDQMAVCSNGVPPGGSISVSPTSLPPLQPGRYYFTVYNPSTSPATNVYIIAKFDYAAVHGSADFLSTGSVPLQDDSVVTNTLVITNTDKIYSAAVGVVLDHPRVSDLTLTLLDPTGQRYILFENRGGPNAQNLGHLNITTNFFGTVSAGDQKGSTNSIGPVPTQGTIIINYDFYQVPDQIDVYYDGVDIFSKFVNNAGQFVIPYGPGTGTNITIVMDQGGDPSGPSLWTYTPSVVNENYTYLTFTDDTNLAQILIKFALPPFDLTDLGTNYTLNNFELTTNGNYLAPTNIYDAFGGWLVPTNIAGVGTNVITLTNNQVSVVTDPASAYDGSNFLALANGTITRLLSTVPTRQYSVSYSYRGAGIAGWWRGEGDANDSAYPETNGNNGRLIGRFNFPAGEVSQAFQMADTGHNYQFAGTNNYVQIPQSPYLDVGTGSGLTIEGWINPTNLSTQAPLVEWLARVPTNSAITNISILAGPFLNRSSSHYYYLLAATNWTTSERWATNLGGHLATINDANEQSWVYSTFGNYGGTNRNLWIGLNDALAAGNYVWTSGQPSSYRNWRTGEPTDLNGDHYTLILGAANTTPGLWVTAAANGAQTGGPATTNNYGVVEVDALQPNGVQLWVSVTNSPATGSGILNSNGCLYANLVDATNGAHEIWSTPGLVQSNVYQHVALTYNTNSGVATLYYNGTNVASTNLGVFIPKTTGDVLLGKDMSLLANNFFSGAMDEMSIYRRALSDAEIAAIYNVSAQSTNNPGTNGSVAALGKFNPQYHPAMSLAMATVTLDTRTNLIFGDNTNWQRVTYTFIATTNATLFQFTGLEPGILLDDFTVSEAALGNLYYHPEEPLSGLVGESAAGTWTLEIQDNRVGATNAIQSLVSWELNLVLQTNTPVPLTLYPQMPGTNTIPPGQTAYFTVPVPDWAHFATNLLVSANAPVNMYFNQTNFPSGTGPGDVTLLANQTSGIGLPIMMTNGLYPANLPLYTNQSYFLGVQNISTVPVTAVVEVDYDITALTNSAPFTATLATNEAVRYFSFDVTSNAYAATFQLLKLSANANLVASYGTPLPTPTTAAYGSFNASNADQSIYVLTNSTPVPLMAGRWYLGVYRIAPGPVTYSVLAKELDTPTPNVISLTNNVPFTFTMGPGAALTNFFLFSPTNYARLAPAMHFELYHLSGNGDLTVQTNGLPLTPPFYQSSQEPGRTAEYVTVRTNSALTNLTGLWYLGVPNHEVTNLTYTILAVVDTNAQSAFPGAVGTGSETPGGRGGTNIYHVITLNDDGPGSLRYGLNTVGTNPASILFDVSGNIALQSPLVITNAYLTIAGQTAPGDGITLQNFPTLFSGAHDVIMRYLRFRPGNTGTNVTSIFYDGFDGPALSAEWQATLPSPALNASSQATYVGAPQSGFATLGTNTVLRLTNTLTDLTRRGWSTASSFTGSNFVYDVRFNTLVQSAATSIDGFLEIWLINATNSSLYDIVSPFGGSYDASKTFWAGSSIDGSGGTTSFGYLDNTWYHLVLKGNGNQNIRASITDDNGVEKAGMDLNHPATAFGSGFRLGLSQSVGLPGSAYPVDVAVDYASLTGQITENLPANANFGVGDSLAFRNARNIIIDHVSASWSTNALVEVLNSSNITVQWSVLADSFHSTNGLAGQGSVLRFGHGDLSFNHNLYANNYTANPLLGDNLGLDFVNNVVYNWGILPGSSITNDPVADPKGFTNLLNFAANYYLASTASATNSIAFWGGNINTWIFQTNNFIDAYTNQLTVGTNTLFILNGSDTGWSMFTNQYTAFGLPFTLPPPDGTNTVFPSAPAEPAYQAYERVLDFAGAQLNRDRVDLSTINHVRTQSGRFIDSQDQAGGWPGLSSQPAPLDTDQDGLPDYWETTFGLNPTNSADGASLVPNTGFSQLETYLNWLASPHAVTTKANPVSVDLFTLAGGTGRLSFFVTNALNGSVRLTNNVITNYFLANGIYTNSVVIRSNSLAIFTPTNTYTSSLTNPAGFDFYVTNRDTLASLGPVSVSVVVSATNLASAPVLIDLTNGVPYTLTNGNPGAVLASMFRYTPTHASPGALAFELYALSGNAGLLVQTNGLPVAPTYFASSTNGGTNAVLILVQTNAALTDIGSRILPNLNGQWYLSVPNYTSNNLTYTILVQEIPTAPTIIDLTNNVPFTYTAGPGPDLTNFFRFTASDSPSSVLFQLYNQSGNGDLTVQTNALPFAPVLYQTSQQPGNSPESMLITTNGGLASLNARWYLGVPNNEATQITYTIMAGEVPNLSGTVTPGTPLTNAVPPNSTNFYLVNVPITADWVTNTLLFASGPLNVWFTTNTPPTTGNPTDGLLLANATSGLNVFGTNLTGQVFGQAQLVPGSFYYLALVNTNLNVPVTNAVQVDFHLVPPVASAPAVITQSATNISAFAATLQASVIPHGGTTTVWFAYGLTTTYDSFSTTTLLSSNLYSTWPVATVVGSLLPGNTYHFAALATNDFGTNYGGDVSFTTPPAPPAVTTLAASNITATAASLWAQVNPNGASSTVWFEYGTDTSYGSTTPVTVLGNNLNLSQAVTLGIANLQPAMVYHVRAVGANPAGTNYGQDVSFVSPPTGPSVLTTPAANVTAIGATLQASVVPNGADTTVRFAYGLDTSYGSYSGTVLVNGNLTGPQPVGLSVGNLQPGLVYHYQAIGVNAYGTNYGGDLTFTTLAAIPAVTTLAVTNLTATNATLPALVNPNGLATAVYFAYGTTTNYFATTPPVPLTGSLTTSQLASTLLSGLLPGVVYHYQAVATNGVGTNYGGDLSFTNPVSPIGIASLVATNQGGINGYLLTWLAPTNYQFKVQWNAALGSATWLSFTNLVSYTGPVTASNGVFTYFDDGSQSGGLGALRFYRLLLNLPQVFTTPPQLPPGGAVYRVNPLTPWTVNNAATDSNALAVLSYTLTSTVTGTNQPVIGTNSGIITWTPDLSQGGQTAVLTTVVTDNGAIPLSATNSLTVIVNPIPYFYSVKVNTEGVTLQWSGAASNQFQVGYTTNLTSPWTYVPIAPPYLTSSTTNFTYQDTNSVSGTKFYKLRQLP